MNNIKKVKTNLDIKELNEEEVFKISNTYEEIIIYDKKLKEELFEKKFNKKYKKILCLIVDNEDGADEDTIILINDYINKLKLFLLNNKIHFNEDMYNRYLKMMYILESKKIIKKKGRGR